MPRPARSSHPDGTRWYGGDLGMIVSTHPPPAPPASAPSKSKAAGVDPSGRVPLQPAMSSHQPQTARRVMNRAEALELGLVMLAVALAFGSLLPFFGGLWWLPPVVGALLLGAGLVVLFRWRRWSDWVLAVTGMVALLIYHLYALHAATTTFGLPGATALRALRDGLLSGWARMLTVALPADPTGDLLGTPTTMAFLAGVGSALLVLRTRAVISLAIAPLAVLVIGLVFT